MRGSFLLGLLACASAAAQAPPGAPPPVRFEIYGVQEGLPEPLVNDLIEDQYGFVWVATQKGVARFDGQSFRTLRLGDDASALQVFKSLAEAPDGDIWAGEGMHGGLVHYDRQTGQVRHYLAEAEPGRGLSEPEVFIVEALADGRVAAFTTNRAQEVAEPTGKCLDLLDPETGTFTPIRTGLPAGRIPGFRCDPLLLSLHWFNGPTLQDRHGGLWIGTAGGPYRLGPGRTTLPLALPSFQRPYPAADYARLDALLAARPPLAAFTRVGNDADRTATFDLTRRTTLLLVGAGEFDRSSAHDVGWLESARGDTLWAMDLLRSAWAGGRRSNQLVVDTLALPPGRYRLRYRSDHNWSFGNWFAPHAPPVRPAWWGLQALALSPGAADLPTITRRTEPDATAPAFPTALLEGRDGAIWMGTRRGELHRYDPATNRYTPLDFFRPAPFGLDPAHVRALHEDEEGVLWVGTWGKGLYRVDPRTRSVRRFRFSAHLDPAVWPRVDDVRTIASDPDGTVWVGTMSGLVHLDPRTGGFNIYGRRFEANAPPGIVIMRVLRGQDGTLWVSTGYGGLARLDRTANAIRVVTHTEGESYDLPARQVEGLVEGADGTVWVGSDRGLMHYDPATGSIITPDLGAFATVFDRGVVPLLAEPNGDLWLIDRARRVLYRHNPGAGTLTTFPSPEEGFPGVPPRLRRVDGTYWFATGNEGLFRFDPDDGSFTPYPFRPAPRASGRVGSRVLPLVSDSLNQREIRVFYGDRRGRLWIGTDEGGLDRFDPATGTFASYYSPEGGLPNVYAIADRGDGTLWLGGWYGLGRFDPATGEHVRIEPTGGEALIIYSLVPDARGSLWAATDRGLLRYDPEHGTARLYGADYALGWLYGPLRLRSGEILFHSREGLVVVDPDALEPDTRPPRVVLEALTAEGRGTTETIPLLDRPSVSLPHDRNDLALAYVGLDYDAPDDVTYAYRLDGYDERWQEVGDLRTARYPNLPPGRYTFRVRARNADGYWSAEDQPGASFSLVVRPPWWETAWARLLGALALAGLLYGAYRYRLARRLAVERLRLRIAADLHDDLGAGLTQVSLMSELARRSAKEPAPEAAEWAEKIGEETRSLAERMRDVVWMIRPDEEAWAALEDRMRDAGAGLLGPLGVAFEMQGEAEGPAPALPLEVRRHVLLAYKEALTNAARHAGAARVEVAWRLSRGGLVLRVCDDGVGFDPETVQRDGSGDGGGNGLRNLRARAEAVGGAVEIESGVGSGTCVTFSVPLRRRRWRPWSRPGPLPLPPPAPIPSGDGQPAASLPASEPSPPTEKNYPAG